MKKVTIYHNPRCSKSRQTLSLLQENSANLDIETIEYLSQAPSKNELQAILQGLNFTPRELMRQNEEVYKSLGLDDANLSEEQLITAMIENPRLIERPIVVVNPTDKAEGIGVAIGRPPESVLSIL